MWVGAKAAGAREGEREPHLYFDRVEGGGVVPRRRWLDAHNARVYLPAGHLVGVRVRVRVEVKGRV